jgi:hypothetical protein
MPSLKPEEEAEFQSVIRGRPTEKHLTPSSAEQESRDSGYVVMTRIRVVDHWTWTTWMCCDTYTQAVAHAGKGDKVVRFSSDEWASLRQQKWAEQPQQPDTAPAIHTNSARETLPSRLNGEPLVEFVLRLLSELGLDQHAESISDVKRSSINPADPLPFESKQDDRLTSESYEQTSIIETPVDMVGLVSTRLNESEISELERIHGKDLRALLKVRQNQSQTVIKRYH